MAKVTLEAQDKPAREVLKELMHLEEQANSELSMRHPVFDHWTLGCDGTGAAWCFIEVRGRYTGRCMWACPFWVRSSARMDARLRWQHWNRTIEI